MAKKSKSKPAPKSPSKTVRAKSSARSSQSLTSGERATNRARSSITRGESLTTSKRSTPKLPIVKQSSRKKSGGSAKLTRIERELLLAFEREYRASEREREKRAAAARKGWETRRAVAEPAPRQTRSEAAKKSWDTRRQNAISRKRITVKANPDDEDSDEDSDSGDFAYQLYDNAHPLHGDTDTIARWHNRLKPLYGSRLRLTLNGYTTDPATGKRTRTYIRRVGFVAGYGDVFGPGALYSKAIKTVRNRHSVDELVVTSVTVELADDADVDDEDND